MNEQNLKPFTKENAREMQKKSVEKRKENKKASIEWIEFIEWVDLKRECLLKEDLDNIYRIMFKN